MMNCIPDPLSSWWAGRRVAVTGATGFVGHHVCVALVTAGASVTALSRRTSDTSRLRSFGVECTVAPLDDGPALAAACQVCDVLIHLAAAVDFNDDWDRCRRVNVGGTINVLRAAREAGVRRVVHASSIAAVGAGNGRLLTETATWDLGSRRVAYVNTKRDAEQYILGLGRFGGPEIVVVNPASVVGPEDFSGSEFGTLCQRFWRGRVPFVFGGGNNFVDVRDVADGVLRAAERGRPGERYILGGENRSYSSFFSELARAAGRRVFRLRLPTLAARMGATLAARFASKQRKRPRLSPAQARLLGLYFYFDDAKARTELGYTTRPLVETLAETYHFWMVEPGVLATRSPQLVSRPHVLVRPPGLRHGGDRIPRPALDTEPA